MSTRQIVQVSLHQWNAIGPSGEVMGQMYKDGAQGVYTARVSGEVFRSWSRADALLWLRLKTCDKESRDAYMRGQEAEEPLAPGEVQAADRDLGQVGHAEPTSTTDSGRLRASA